MKDTTCCTFHHHGGPISFDCDDYGLGDDSVSATAEDYDAQPLLRASDLCDWDAYSGADAEEASAAVDAAEAPIEA